MMIMIIIMISDDDVVYDEDCVRQQSRKSIVYALGGGD